MERSKLISNGLFFGIGLAVGSIVGNFATYYRLSKESERNAPKLVRFGLGLDEEDVKNTVTFRDDDSRGMTAHVDYRGEDIELKKFIESNTSSWASFYLPHMGDDKFYICTRDREGNESKVIAYSLNGMVSDKNPFE